MSEYLYPVPENPPDEGDFIMVVFNRQWLPFVLGVLLPLKNPNIWNEPPDDISDQVSELIQLMQTTSLFSFWTLELPETANSDDTGAVELGIAFSTSVAGNIVGLRFYKGSENLGEHTGYLYAENGDLLGELTFEDETASGWQEAYFDDEIPISACDTYVASYYAPNGKYSTTREYFEDGYNNPPLYAKQSGFDVTSLGNGRYRYGSPGEIPEFSYQSTNYWVDVIFEPTGADFVANI